MEKTVWIYYCFFQKWSHHFVGQSSPGADLAEAAIIEAIQAPAIELLEQAPEESEGLVGDHIWWFNGDLMVNHGMISWIWFLIMWLNGDYSIFNGTSTFVFFSRWLNRSCYSGLLCDLCGSKPILHIRCEMADSGLGVSKNMVPQSPAHPLVNHRFPPKKRDVRRMINGTLRRKHDDGPMDLDVTDFQGKKHGRFGWFTYSFK